MKYVFGSIITLLLLIVVLYYTLSMWGVELPITSNDLSKIVISGFILLVTIVLLKILLPFFFGNARRKHYDPNKGNVAKPKL